MRVILLVLLGSACLSEQPPRDSEEALEGAASAPDEHVTGSGDAPAPPRVERKSID